ncbi:unnamed protein product [Mytilus coruscus]|uniref:Helix-turn-helix domain-containing protein n=1 Tax=Mytilus coruscus TaxID=42192 RepID=A0A6J8BZ54_MYTCO|nr:unnamed protein product [Mytilus coruscus]
MRYSTEKIEFLDVFVNIENGQLKTDLYTKSTDKHQYLHVSSSHPNSVKNAIPYGLGIRVKRICSTEENYKIRREEIKTHLKKRGYNNSSTECNVVFSGDLGSKINLREFTLTMTNTHNDPKTFSGVIWQHRHIAGNCLLFGNGKINCNDLARSISEGRKDLDDMRAKSRNCMLLFFYITFN